MLIDIHRHSPDKRDGHICVRNLFHYQTSEARLGGYYSAGLHPWHVQEGDLGRCLDLVGKAAGDSLVIAIGEAGLDKTIETPFAVQLQAFEAQIEIAQKANKPMIIHCVRAYNEVYELKCRSGHRQPWIIHWFNANEQTARQLIHKDFYLSFGHMLFKQDSKAYKAFPHLPLEYIFFETDDAGYSIEEIYLRASELLSIPLTHLEKRIEQNFANFFRFAP
jgi:TatD DNase family protein